MRDGSFKVFRDDLKNSLLKTKIFEEIRKVWEFSGKIFITLICIWIFQVGFRFELLPIIGVYEFALFSVGYSVAVLIFAGCEQILNSYCLPLYYAKIESDSIDASSSWNWLSKIAFPTYILALLFTISFSEILVLLILDSSYKDAGIYVKLAAFLEFLRVTYSFVSLHAHGINNTKLLVLPSLIGLLIFFIGYFSLKYFTINNSLLLLAMLSNFIAISCLWLSYRKDNNNLKILDTLSLIKLLPISFLLFFTFSFLPQDLSFITSFFALTIGMIIYFFAWISIVWQPVLEIINKFKAESK